MAEVCAVAAVGLTLVPTIGDVRDRQRVADADVDGFVVWTNTEDDPVLEAVAATGLRAVVHAGPRRPGLPVIGIDDRAAARAIGREAFAGAGCPAVLSFPLDRSRRRQLLWGAVPATATFPVTRKRWEGYLDAWADLDGEPARLRVAVCPSNSAAHGETFTRELLSSTAPPDGIAAMSDELALGALDAASQTGVDVPTVLAVTGWDDTDAAAPAGLTTLAQSLRDQGSLCAHLALGHTESTTGGDQSVWQVIHRRSTRRFPPP